MIHRLAALALVGLTLGLGGCYEGIAPAYYEAGVYKGASDPLTGKLDAGDLQGDLRARFEIAARDR